MNGGEEGLGVFGVSCGDPTPAFEMKECIFDPMAQLIEIFVVGALNGSVFLRRYNNARAVRGGLFNDGIRIVPLIGDQLIGGDTFDQL